MKHVLPTDTVNKVLNYLATKPYSEVNTLVQEIMTGAKEFVEAVASPPVPEKKDE